MATKKSKIGPISVTRTHNRIGYPSGGYKNMADAVLGPTRGNLARTIMPKPRTLPKMTPPKIQPWKPRPLKDISNGIGVGP